MPAQVFQFATSNEAEIFARGPAVPERKPQVVIDLFEAELVAQHAFENVSVNRVTPVLFPVERFPNLFPAVSIDPNDCFSTNVFRALEDLVDGVVR